MTRDVEKVDFGAKIPDKSSSILINREIISLIIQINNKKLYLNKSLPYNKKYMLNTV